MGAKEQGADAGHGRWVVIPRTLSFILCGDDVLLLKRAPHKRVFPNQYNGLGGHIERDEDPLSSARREVKEESGLDVADLRLFSVHNIDAGAQQGIVLFVFVGHTDERQFSLASEEGQLEWVSLRMLHRYNLVEDVAMLLQRIAQHHWLYPLFAHVSYDDRDRIQMRFVE